jgi:hypothetical protein
MNQKMDSEESSLVPNSKSGQSKSVQRLSKKIISERINSSSKGKESSSIHKQKSLKLLKSSKFDTPEKKNSPKPHRDLQKSPIVAKKSEISTPFPSNIQLFSKKNLGSLIKSAKKSKFNPMHLAPVLIKRKTKDQDIALSEARPLTPADFESSDYKLTEVLDTQNTSEALQEKDSPSKLFFYKASQPSFGEEFEEEPIFLSDRLSHECESNQSLKFDLKKVESDQWELSESLKSLRSGCEKFDNETQTDEDAIEGMLKVLDDHDIQIGIKFISKIAKFVQTLNV